MSELEKRRPNWGKREWIEFAELQRQSIERLERDLHDQAEAKHEVACAMQEKVDYRDGEIERLEKALEDEKFYREVDATNARENIGRLEKDQADWRKGVELIASALGETDPPNLSCARLSEEVLHREAKIERLEKEVERLQGLTVWMYNQGYGAGHNDTVEGCYTDVLPVDKFTYHDDVVSDLLEGS